MKIKFNKRLKGARIHMSKKSVSELLKKYKRGARLDCGCGGNKQPGYLGLDIRPLPGVNVVHDVESTPYPFPDNSFSTILCSHLVEHLKPWLIIDIFNEWWRIMQPKGQLLVSTPYAGSFGFWQDPTHVKGYNQASFTYFDPREFLYGIYRPKPWLIERNAWWENGNLEVIMSKIDTKQGLKIEANYNKARAAQGQQVYGKPEASNEKK